MSQGWPIEVHVQVKSVIIWDTAGQEGYDNVRK